MTRASLLHILDHVTAVSDVEVRELEQLATAFPYCQTAHLLLAKAAHDKGSMLTGQRLRRAATYAADRHLLRQLIELPVALDNQDYAPLLLPETAVATDTTAVISLPEVTGQPPAGPTPDTSSEAPAPAADLLVETPTPAVAVVLAPEPAEAIVVEADSSAIDLPEEAQQPQTLDESAADAALLAVDLPPPAAEPLIYNEVALLPLSDPGATAAETDAAPEALLPATAPPIRPPADAGTSRFEFGLADPALPVPALYELNGETKPSAAVATTPRSPAFYADPDVGYGLDLGSRLGASLQFQGILTSGLPPTEFFTPDALLLAHIAAHAPEASVKIPTSLAIIDQFLKNKPRLKSPAAVPPPAEEQTDLSVPSTSATPALASESLAKIMVKQGKVAKAIEIYERLMVRQPEKKAYFADQIAQLKSSE